ncbi:hypothetical protein HJC22_18100 [Corallococcus exiguus]|uniref:hypothetical protein n=1 Tax=Corallococcus TaxID=83461 RepID=UPI000EEBEB1A|nr:MULTISPECIES: hypothetical protein [Corallococcus]NNC17633.1 hypothetical protein [Corallococcus exiguus]NPC71036.1 hypothetical protein [Corallococcus exiguus]RKI18916.1 hypothetical protein D7Y15_06735 [Corallococcus sp. AB030]
MTPLHPWINNALEELTTLTRQHAAESLSAGCNYRVLVLRARLDQARAAGMAVPSTESLLKATEQIASAAESDAPEDMLSRLDEQLSDDDDPFGELLDALLGIDDAVTVAEARGRILEAQELARLAEAAVSLAPARTVELGRFAERRLMTMPDTASIRSLWDTVRQAPGELASEVLPPVRPSMASLRQRRLLERLQALHTGPGPQEEEVSDSVMVRRLQDAAAASPPVGSKESFEGLAVDLFEDEHGQWNLQIALPEGHQPGDHIELRWEAKEQSSTWRVQVIERSRRTVLARLGSLEALRERLRAEGLIDPMARLRLFVSLPHEISK